MAEEAGLDGSHGRPEVCIASSCSVICRPPRLGIIDTSSLLAGAKPLFQICNSGFLKSRLHGLRNR